MDILHGDLMDGVYKKDQTGLTRWNGGVVATLRTSDKSGLKHGSHGATL